jgi:hypothetical protein
MDWALRDLLIAYLDLLVNAAQHAYEVNMHIWAVLAAAGGKVKRPDPPAILKVPKIILGG